MARRSKKQDPAVQEAKLTQGGNLADQFGADASTQATPDAYQPPALGGVAPTAQTPDQEAQRKSTWDGYGLWDAVKDNYAGESLIFTALNQAKETGFPVDPNYSLPGVDSPEWKTLTKDIPEQYLPAFGRSVSADHANYIRDKIHTEMDTEQRVSDYTGGGLARLALGFTNPEGLALAASTGGAGWVAKGKGVASQFLRAGAVNAAATVPYEAAITAGSDTKSASDIVGAGVGAFALGGLMHTAIHGAVSRFMSPEDKAKVLTGMRAERTQALVDAGDPEAVAAAYTKHVMPASELDPSLQPKDGWQFPDNAISFVAKDSAGKQIAHVTTVPSGGQLRLVRMDTAEAARGRGIAKSLLGDAIDHAHANDMPYVSDTQMSTGAQKVHESLTGREILANKSFDVANDSTDGAVHVSSNGRPLYEAPKGETFGPDSASAARVAPDTMGKDLRDGSKVEPVVHDQPMTTMSGLRIGPFKDDAAVLHDIKDPTIRDAVAPYTGEPGGSSDGRAVAIGAAEEAHTIRRTSRAAYGIAHAKNLKAWMKENNQPITARLSRTVRRAFGEEVTLHRMGIKESESPSVMNQAKYEDKFYDKFRQQAKDAGVKGFQELDGPPAGQAYRPRVYDKAKIGRLAQTERFGTGTLEKLIAKAFISANKDAGEDIARKVGKGIIKKLRESNAGINDSVAGLREADGEWLQGLIHEVNADGSHDDVAEYLKNMFDMKKGEGEGSLQYAKHRTLLDETASIDATDRATGETRPLPFHELLVNDAETLADTYSHRVSGAIGFAKRAGIESATDHKSLMNQVKAHYEANGDIPGGTKVTQAMDRVYKLSHGQSLINPGEPVFATQMRKVMRSMRDFAYITKMNMAWMANLSDSAGLLVGAQAKRIFRYMPEMGDMFKRMQDGTLKNEFAAEMERNTGLAMEDSFNQGFSAFDDNMDKAGSKVAHGIRMAGGITQHLSGLGKLQNVNQRLYGIGYATRLADNLLGKSKDLGPKRMASAGIDEAMGARIKTMIETHGTLSDTGAGVKIQRLNTDDWTDAGAGEAFWAATAREGRRAVQEEIHGEAPGWLNTPWGKVAGQFRRFGIVSHSKQLVFALRHADAESAQKVVHSFGIGAVSYAAQMYLYSMTKPAKDQQAFRDKYLSPGAIAWGAFSRAGMFSMTPAIWQTLQEGLTHTSPVNARVSGLNGNIFTGIPAVDLTMRSYNFLSNMATAAVRSDRQFNQKNFKDAKGILPYQNAPGVSQLLDWLGSLLPEKDDDTDSKHASFVGFDHSAR